MEVEDLEINSLETFHAQVLLRVCMHDPVCRTLFTVFHLITLLLYFTVLHRHTEIIPYASGAFFFPDFVCS